MSNRIFCRIQRISCHQCGILRTMLPVNFQTFQENCVVVAPELLLKKAFAGSNWIANGSLEQNIEYDDPRCHRHSFLTFYTSKYTSQARISTLFLLLLLVFAECENIFGKHSQLLAKLITFSVSSNPKLLRLNTVSTHPAQRQFALWFNNSCIYMLDLFSNVCLKNALNISLQQLDSHMISIESHKPSTNPIWS